MFLTRREPGVPLSLFRSYPLPFPPPFLFHCSLITLPCLLSFSLIYICCSFRGGILSAVFPTVAICFWPAGNPCLFSDLILFPFLPLSLYIVPYPSFSSMSFSLIYICCSFRGGILSVVFPTVAICFWPAGNLECPCPFSDLIFFPFSPPFLLYCYLPFLFFYVFFMDLYLL